MNSQQTNKVVLLHGWGGNSQSVWAANGWYEALDACGFAPMPIDLPGHGAASASHDALDYADLAAYVLDELGDTGPVSAIGYSLGSKVLLELAIRRPEMFRRLVIGGLGANAFAPERAGELVAKCLVNGPTDDTPPAVQTLAQYGIAAGNDPLAIAAVLRRPPNPMLSRERVSAVSCPVLLVSGDADQIATPVSPLAEALPNGEVVMLEGVDHLSLPAADGFQDAALRFLSSRNEL
ncbi:MULTISPECIES: alpha/beta hydrolase [unclassified Burkholderia]|uniref:alpha/beta fold hydrolase n=1 Tax=unclassified Burkholderia TaxID=2613784 RepID=UPI002AB2ADAD|nr:MULTISPECIES: alpha/beta hydrolase [unclassified Burkholderia]